MNRRRLDAKLLMLVAGTFLVALLGAKSLFVTGEGSDDRGFDGAEPLPLDPEVDTSPPLGFTPPATPRNPFVDGRTDASRSTPTGSADESEQADDPDDGFDRSGTEFVG